MQVLHGLLAVMIGLSAAGTGHAQTILLSEDFDGITPPAVPAAWTIDAGWETSASAPSSGSGVNNLMNSGSAAGSAVLPEVDLTGAAFATLTYTARRSGTYDLANLRVSASTDGGATFSTTMLPAGAALPASALTYETLSVALPSSLLGSEEVVIRFEALGLSSSGSNARIDDVVLEMYAPGESGGGTFGFAAAAGSAPAEDDGIDLPLRLAFSAPQGLQAIQFRVSWSLDSLRLVGVAAGAAVEDEEAWSLSYEARASEADVVLIGKGATALPPGTYDTLLTLRFAAGALESEQVDVPTLSNVVGALATPEGEDAGITTGTRAFVLTIAPGAAVFLASPALVDVGDVDVGSDGSALVTVSNPGGAKDLEITSVSSSNPLFTVSPEAGVLAPDESLPFTITFAPVDTAFGLQEAQLVFQHGDGAETITIIGKGRGGRGDAEGDGSVDVLDVVHAIDFVLARISPGPLQTAAADLFPFPEGDDELDVRDLTVLSQAVAHGQWPDGLLLPADVALAGKSAAGAGHVVLRYVGAEGDANGGVNGGAEGAVMELQHDVPIRGFQLIFPDASPGAVVDAPAGATLKSGYDEVRGELRILGYLPDGASLPPGVRRISVSEPLGTPRYATAIGEDRERLVVEIRVSTPVEREAVPEVQLGTPYPNPFNAGTDVLRISSVPAGAEVDVFDLLGRRVISRRIEGSAFTWNGRDPSGQYVAPGLYITRLRSRDIEGTWTVILTR